VIERLGLLGVHVQDREVFVAFNCSMMTQIDELENERFIRMTEIEFMEAMARCAYVLPNQCRVEDIFGTPTPFYAKFEWMIHEMKAQCGEEVRTMFQGSVSLFNKSEEDD
jgi:hypothetical protein